MLTAEFSFDSFLKENAGDILSICYQEGFNFLVKESSRCITVQCILPDSTVRFIVFDDHRLENPHGGKPHVCNQWHKSLGDPLSFTTGRIITDDSKRRKILLAVSVMCITQSAGYAKMKESIFG